MPELCPLSPRPQASQAVSPRRQSFLIPRLIADKLKSAEQLEREAAEREAERVRLQEERDQARALANAKLEETKAKNREAAAAAKVCVLFLLSLLFAC